MKFRRTTATAEPATPEENPNPPVEEATVPAERYEKVVRLRNDDIRRAEELRIKLDRAESRADRLREQLDAKSELARQLSGSHLAQCGHAQRAALAEKALAAHADRLEELTVANVHAYRRIAELEDQCRALRAAGAVVPVGGNS